MVEELKCPICQKHLLKDESPTLGFRYQCEESSDRHYLGYIGFDSPLLEEESVILVLDGKKYTITQYNEPPVYDLVIVASNEEGHYEYSTELSFRDPPFDFLHNELNINVKRLKTILTFR